MDIESTVNLLLILSYVLMGIGAVGAILFPLYQMTTDFSKAKNALIGVAGTILLFAIGYMFSSGEVLPAYEKFGITPELSRFIGSTMVMVYILGIGVLVLAVVGEIYNALR